MRPGVIAAILFGAVPTWAAAPALRDRTTRTVTPAQIVAAYAENGVDADERFKGRLLLMRGFIQSVGVKGDDGFLFLSTAYDADTLEGEAVFVFEGKDRRQLAKLRKGSAVIVECGFVGIKARKLTFLQPRLIDVTRPK